MKTSRMFPTLVLVLASGVASAYPPAPFHRVLGKVRDDHGNPFGAGDCMVILYGSGDKEIVRNPTDPGLGDGLNYSLSVPMDAGVTDQLYTVSALRPAYPFTIRVLRGSTSYVPIQMKGTSWAIGQAAQSTRLDLTLGIDSDGDGLPDAWENEVIRGDPAGRLKTLADVNPDGDADGDGLTNRQEYIAGTYATDPTDGLSLEITSVSNGIAKLRFLAIAKRTYRLKSSENLTAFAEQPFSLKLDATGSGASWVAPETTWQEIYVAVGTAPAKQFRLYVE